MHPSPSVPSQRDLILLVDNEPMILEAFRRPLESGGIQVITATNVEAARAAITEHRNRIAIVFCEAELNEAYRGGDTVLIDAGEKGIPQRIMLTDRRNMSHVRKMIETSEPDETIDKLELAYRFVEKVRTLLAEIKSRQE